MEILVNNRTEAFDKEEMSLAELIELKKFSFKLIIYKVNGKLVKKEEYENTIIRHGDSVQAIHMISGG
jgi:sulfur carrier protein